MPKSKEFKELLGNVRSNYLGKKVPLKYRSKYGKRYDKKETTSVAYAIAKSRGIRIDK